MAPRFMDGEIYSYSDRAFNGTTLKLTASFRAWAEAQILLYLQNNNLDTTGDMISVTRTERDAGQRTLGEYHERYREMHIFACILGDWRTASIFARRETDRDNPRLCPNNPQPADPETIAKFIAWKCTPFDATNDGVCKFEGKAVTDVNNVPLRVRSQQWRAPCNVDKFIASVKALHLTYENLRQPFQNRCRECLQLNPQLNNRATSSWKSCMVHAGQPRLMPLGNVTTSPIVRSEAQRAKNALDEKHIRKGSVQLLPGHIRTIYSTLMGRIQTSGSEAGIFWLMVWVMILIGFNCFLRAKELLSLKVKHIRKDGVKVTNGVVKSLILEVADGKADGNKSVFLKLHMQRGKFAFLCPVTWLLYYVDVARIRDPEGYLFLSRTRIEAVALGKEVHSSEIPALTYESYRKTMRQLISSLFPDLLNESRKTVGTHTLRYLGYTYAIWGTIHCNLQQNERDATKKALEKLGSTRHIEEYVNPLPIPCYSEIMTSARHASIMSANYYMQTCTTLYWCVQEDASAERELQAVPYWKSIYIGNDIQNVTSLLLYSRDNQQELHELADYFLRSNVGLPSQREERVKTDHHKLLTRLVDKPEIGSDTLLPYLMDNMKPEMAQKIMELIAHDMERAREAGREEMRREMGARMIETARARKRPAASVENCDKSPTAENNTQAAFVTTRKEGDDNTQQRGESLDELREEYKLMALTGMDVDLKEFHNLIKRVMAAIPAKGDGGGAKWKQRVIKWNKQFKDCIRDCHGGDEASFYNQQHCGKFPVKKVICVCKNS